jgi:hypothetical protein
MAIMAYRDASEPGRPPGVGILVVIVVPLKRTGSGKPTNRAPFGAGYMGLLATVETSPRWARLLQF